MCNMKCKSCYLLIVFVPGNKLQKKMQFSFQIKSNHINSKTIIHMFIFIFDIFQT